MPIRGVLDMHGTANSRQKLLEDLNSLIQRPRYDFVLLDCSQGTEGWAFYLLPSFKDALDIKYLTKGRRQKSSNDESEKHNSFEWQQRSAFSFKRGYRIYDTKDAYELDWSEALKKINSCVQVRTAKAAVPEHRTTYVQKIAGKESVLTTDRQRAIYNALDNSEKEFSKATDDVKKKTEKSVGLDTIERMKKLGAMKIRFMITTPRNKGSVTFDTLLPDKEKTGLFPSGKTTTTTQDDFIRFLISGKL